MLIKCREEAWGPSASSEVQGAKGEKTESYGPEGGGEGTGAAAPSQHMSESAAGLCPETGQKRGYWDDEKPVPRRGPPGPFLAQN